MGQACSRGQDRGGGESRRGGGGEEDLCGGEGGQDLCSGGGGGDVGDMRGRPLLLLRGASQESAAAVLLARRAAPGSPSSSLDPAGQAGTVWAIVTAVKIFDLVVTLVGVSAHGLCYHASFQQLVTSMIFCKSPLPYDTGSLETKTSM